MILELDIKLSLAVCRGSLEIGDMLSDVSAAPMEMTLLGVQGKVFSSLSPPGCWTCSCASTACDTAPRQACTARADHMETIEKVCALQLPTGHRYDATMAAGARRHDERGDLRPLQHERGAGGGRAPLPRLAAAHHGALHGRCARGCTLLRLRSLTRPASAPS